MRRGRDRAAVERRRAAALGGEQLVAQRVVDDADERAVGVLAGDADRPLRDAEEEVDRAVERVDDPAHAARARVVAALLPQHAVVRAGGGDPLADQVLGGVVGLGDEVGRRALGGDPQLRAVERLAQQRARLAGDGLGQRAQLAGASRRHRRTVRGPVAGALELGGERDEPRLGVRRADELDGEREAVRREAGGHRRRRAGRCG